MIDFFTQPDLEFGGVSATTGVFWLVLLAVGVYLITQWRQSNPLRYRFGRQVGIVSIVLGGLGVILLALNLFQVPPFNIRLWIYLIGLASLAYLGYALYVYNAKLPAQIAATRTSRTVSGSSQRGARTYATTGTPAAPKAPRDPRPIATTTRREARRDKKRKSR